MRVVYHANYFVWFEVGRTDLLRQLGWSYREMEHAGFQLPVVEAHCHYLRPARYDDEIEIRTAGRLVSAVRVAFDYEAVRKRRRRRHGDGADAARSGDAGGAAVPAATASEGTVSMKALDHRRRPGSSARTWPGRCSNAAPRSRDWTASRTTTRGRSRKRTSPAVATHDRFRFVETSIQDADLDALLDDVTHVFHLAAQAGVRKELGPRLPDLHDQQRRRDAGPARVGRRAADREARLRLELLGLRRRRADPDARAGAAAPALAIRRHQAGRRAVVPPVRRQSRRAGHRGALLHRVWPSPAP